MKNILRYLCALIVVMCALPAMGQDYLTVHFKDGTNRRFYLGNVLQLKNSNYDVDGNLHTSAQTCQIVMADSTFSYGMETIDSLSFHKVTEEMIKDDLISEAKNVLPVYSQCNTLDEVSEHLDEIKRADNVEDAYLTNNMLVVKWKNKVDSHFLYPVKPRIIESENTSNYVKEMLSAMKANRHMPQDTRKVLLINQVENDEDPFFANATRRMHDIYSELVAAGMEVVYVPNIYTKPDLDFFWNTDFSQYDFICLQSHGGFDGAEHDFLTSSEIIVLDEEELENVNDPYSIPAYRDAAAHFFAPTPVPVCWHKEIRGGKTKIVYYAEVTESFLTKNIPNRDFQKNEHAGCNKTIMFSGCCKSLEGNDNMAYAFFQRGVGVYLGYDETNDISHYANGTFVENLFNGYSVQAAYQSLPYEYRVNKQTKVENNVTTEFTAHLRPVYQSNAMGNACVTEVFTTRYSDSETLEHYDKTGCVTLNGRIKLLHPDGSKLKYGFKYGYEKSLYDAVDIAATNKGYVNGLGFYVFDADVKVETTAPIYYQAYVFDGYSYCYGEVESVGIPKITITSLTLTESARTMIVGEAKPLIARILPENATDKTLAWGSSEPSVCQVDYLGNVTALKPGTCTLTVRTTDGSNLSATCRVTVQEEEKPQPQHYLRVYNYDYSIGADGGTVTLDYDSDVDCNLRTNVDWIVGGAGKIVTIKKNTTGDSRKGKVIIENKEYGFTETVTIIQQAGNAPEPQHYITLSESEYRVAAAGGSFTLQYQSDVACTITASENWMSVQGTKVTVSPNTTTNRRTGYVTIANDVYGLSQKVTVIQEPNEEPQHYITLTETEYHVMGTGGRFVVQYKSDVACVISSTVDWITTEGVIITVRPNNTPYRRTGYVTIVNDVYGLSQSVPVIQEPGDDAPQTDGTLLATKTVDGKSYSLFRTQDKNRRRTNPDGTSFYRSKFTLKVADQTFEIDDDVYMHEGVGDDASVCMAYNSSTRTTYMFVTSKDGDEGVYSMEGYLYAISSSGKITKNVVYTYANWGWHPFFLLSDYGDLYLASFSYAGYFYTLGYVEADGSCEFVPIDYIYPEDFQELRRREGGILVY